MSEEKIDIIIEYLNLDMPYRSECGSDFDKLICDENCDEYQKCTKETNIRDRLKETP